MLAEVRIVIAPKEARLTLKHGDDTVEDELWTFAAPLGRAEARQLAEVVFHDTYDLVQYAVHGDS